MDTERAGPSGAARISAADTAPGGSVAKCPSRPERGRRWRPLLSTREGSALRGAPQGEGEGHPDLRGQRLFVPLPKNGARPWLVLSARRRSQSPSFVFGKMDRSSSDIRRGSTWAPGEDGTPGPVWVGTRRPEARPAAPLGADWRDGEGCRRLTGARPFHSCSGAWRAPAAAPFR